MSLKHLPILLVIAAIITGMNYYDTKDKYTLYWTIGLLVAAYIIYTNTKKKRSTSTSKPKTKKFNMKASKQGSKLSPAALNNLNIIKNMYNLSENQAIEYCINQVASYLNKNNFGRY